ncbi:MAG: TetR/AcrR family transcriptional regulator [Acidimicrobiales bacterium]
MRAREAAVEVPRPPGRPRSAEADRAILRAAVDLLADEGYGGVTMEGVAARAGVGKATVYRRWPSKSALVVDAVTACREQRCELPETGSARDDLLAFVGGFMDHLRTSDAGRVMPALVAELSRSPELADAFREGFVQPRRAKVLEAVRRGVERGEVRAGVDPEVVADAVVALLMHRFLITGMEIDDGLPERVLDVLWRGISSSGSPQEIHT